MIMKPSEYYNQNFTFNETTINKGICSLNTAEKLNTTECAKQMVTQPDLILNTINNLMECMCTLEEIIPLESLVLELEYPSVRIPRGLKNSKKIKIKKRKKKPQKSSGKVNRNKNKNRTNKLTPIGIVINTGDEVVSTDLSFGNNYNKMLCYYIHYVLTVNSRHRYPWLCSLRKKTGDVPEHLCAVNLLSRPPGPAVLVGAAHCTYLCR